MLPETNRLRTRKDIEAVHRSGNYVVGRFLLLKCRLTGRKTSRFAFSVSKKVGNAVVRNRWRRRLREIVRLRLPGIKTGYDVVIVVRGPRAGKNNGLVSTKDLIRDLERLVVRAGLLG